MGLIFIKNIKSYPVLHCNASLPAKPVCPIATNGWGEKIQFPVSSSSKMAISSRISDSPLIFSI